MTQELSLERGRELEAVAKVREFFGAVSNVETAHLVRESEVPKKEVVALLRKSGANLEIKDQERESLGESQFRGFNTGKGPGVVAVLGRERAQDYFNWALEASCQLKMPKLKRDRTETEVSRARGLMQFLGLVVGLATGVRGEAGFVQELNQRAYNGHVAKKTKASEDLATTFPGLKRNKKMSSFPPGLLPEAFEKIVQERVLVE